MTEITMLTDLLRQQWDQLFTWLRSLEPDLDELFGQDSAIPEWTIGELVSHLGRAMEALTVCTPAIPGMIPLTYAEYLGTYPERAEDISLVTRQLDQQITADRLSGVHSRAEAAFRHLIELDGVAIVQARRAPIRLTDMVSSRLVELVVHADDLDRSLPLAEGTPVNSAALHRVAEDFMKIVVARVGFELTVTDPLSWVRLAAGREPYHSATITQAVSPPNLSDAVPDLGRVLPLL